MAHRIVYLIDANIWLERLLYQQQSDAVGQMLALLPTEQILISDFSLHSIGVVLCRLHCIEALPEFIEDIFVNGAVTLVSIAPEDMSEVVSRISKSGLDFDDAYQYVAAERSSAHIISFDKDFDRTDIKRKTPVEIIREYV